MDLTGRVHRVGVLAGGADAAGDLEVIELSFDLDGGGSVIIGEPAIVPSM